MLSAALLVGGLNNLQRRPLLGGVLLGLLTYKPQLALLTPVFLLASASGRAMLGFAFSLAGVWAASSACLGGEVWADWFDGLAAYRIFWRRMRAGWRI